MQINVKELEPCKFSVQYEADALEILNKRNEVLNSFKKAPVPGFRQGKASIDAIKFHYKDQIEDSLKRALAEDAYHNTLFEKKFKPHGAPRFDSLIMDGGKFVCEFEIHTKPEFELPNFRSFNVPNPHQKSTDVEIAQEILQELRVKHGDVSTYTDTDVVEKGDNVIVDYDATIDGVKHDLLSAQGEMLSVGAGKFTDFDDRILGMKLGEVREFDLLVPESGLPSLQGKTVHFNVTLNMGSKTTPCPLNDELAKKVGLNDFQELQTMVNGHASMKFANEFKRLVNDAVSNMLVDSTSVDVPNWMSVSEAKYLAHNAKLDWELMLDEDRQRFIQMGERNVKLSLILDKIREKEPEAQLNDNEVFEIVKANLANSRVTASLDEVIKELNRTGYLQILFSRIKDEYALDFVVKNVTLID
jgi:trigger factor